MTNNSKEVKEKIKSWLKDKYNLAFLGVLLLSFIVRCLYLISSQDQTLWWDEAEYMATSKHWALGVPYDLNPQRPPLFQLLGALLLKLGFEELSLKFFLVLLPSVALIFAIYLVGKEMFGKKIALVASLASSFVWSLLFWSTRFQPDFFSVTFQLFSILFFWKLFKHGHKKHAILAGVFAALGFYFKISALLVPLSVLIFVLFKDKLSFIKNKSYWIALAAFIATLIPFAIWQFYIFGNPIAFAPSYSGDFNEGRELGWMALTYFQIFPKTLFFVLFLIGLFLTLSKVALSFDILWKDKEKRLNPWVFSLIILLTNALFYVFYIKGVIEDRWIFLIIPFIMFFSSYSLIYLSDKLRPYYKYLPIIVIGLVMVFFAYTQLEHTSSLIQNKQASYAPIKEASLLVKELSQPGDSFLSVSYTQSTAYSEREVLTYAKMPLEEFLELLNTKKPKFLLISIYEPHHPDWILQQGVQNGNQIVYLPYLNSTIAVSPQGQVIYNDVKRVIGDENKTFELVYPLDQVNGAFLYRITYR